MPGLAERARDAPIQTAAGRARRVLAWLCALLVLQHVCWPPVYRFPPPAEFAGERWYNPYADLGPERLRANTHAHSTEWLGLTNGARAAGDVRALYAGHGYAVPIVSNYQSIDSPPAGSLAPPAYEHGYGLGQQHQTVLGAERVEWLDYLLPQWWRQEQHVLDALRPMAEFLILNHPWKRGGYGLLDARRLCGYDAVEIATSQRSEPTGTRFWDEALRSGRRVWGVCADDSHQQTEELDLFHGWIEVAERCETRADVLAALRRGRYFSVFSPGGAPAVGVASVEVSERGLVLRFDRPAEFVRFVSSSGVTSRRDRAYARYEVRPEDGFVRAEVHSGGTITFLNPIHRYRDDPEQPRLVAEVRPAATLASRATGAALALLSGWWLLLRRRATSARAPTGP